MIEKGDQTYSLWEWENFGLKLLADDLECVQVMACGDQLLHKAVIARGMRDDDYSYLYAGIRDVIGTADLASLNQETPLVSDKALVSDYPRFGSPAESAKAVASLGIDIVSTANNHALDQGMYGVDTTLSVYEDLGIVPVGTHASDDPADDPEDAVRFLDCKDIRLALLSFTYGTNGNVIPAYPHAVERLTEEDRMRTALRYARENADAVIVYAHWGTEYRLQTDEMQAYYTDLFAEEGVDVVIGTHPHVLQEYVLQRNETGHTMLVYYSLGNLISAQTREECRTGGVASFGLVRTGRGRVCILSPELLEVITEQDSVQWKERP